MGRVWYNRIEPVVQNYTRRASVHDRRPLARGCLDPRRIAKLGEKGALLKTARLLFCTPERPLSLWGEGGG